MDLDDEACYRAFRTRDARFDGRIFCGVRTTGIYCRPICPARTPKLQNVQFYRSAAAAQVAGFRPCLRCRPDTSPELAAWHGTSSSVTRALALIEAGALDQGDVEALAERVGMGSRQLRRLFQVHLGATPIAVAQTRRVLLAKQLLHDSQLSMAEIALASGFGSVRRFNEVFRTLFQRPPAALRRSRSQARQAADSAPRPGIALQLSYRPPYDLASVLAFLATRAIPGVEQVSATHYARTIESAGVHGTLHVRAGKGDRLHVTIHTPALPALPAWIARVRRLFDLAADPAAIAAHLQTDALLAPMLQARPGLRVPGAWDGFELAIRAILGQQVSVQAATQLAGQLVQLCGEPLRITGSGEPGLTRVFPSPERVASADLSSLKMPRTRIATLARLAAVVAADPHLLAPGRELPEAVARLRSIPGIGEWTAQYIAMRQLREPDAFPTADIGLLRALEREGQRPSAAQLSARAEAWRPWRAYAALHLWTASPPTKNPKDSNHARSVA